MSRSVSKLQSYETHDIQQIYSTTLYVMNYTLYIHFISNILPFSIRKA